MSLFSYSLIRTSSLHAFLFLPTLDEVSCTPYHHILVYEYLYAIYSVIFVITLDIRPTLNAPREMNKMNDILTIRFPMNTSRGNEVRYEHGEAPAYEQNVQHSNVHLIT